MVETIKLLGQNVEKKTQVNLVTSFKMVHQILMTSWVFLFLLMALVEMDLSFLLIQNFPLSLWSFAFQTAIFFVNCLPTLVLGFMSPYKKLYHHFPDYSLLKVFCCACFLFLRPYNEHKLLFWSKEYIFIGYNSNHKGNLCLNLSSGQIYISRHVVFNESFFLVLRLLSLLGMHAQAPQSDVSFSSLPIPSPIVSPMIVGSSFVSFYSSFVSLPTCDLVH